MKRIEEISLDGVFEIILDEDVFPHSGEFQTLFGFTKNEMRSIRSLSIRGDVPMTIDLERLRISMVEMLKGYPHGCEKIIRDRYAVDVEFI
jgi:hypothetical protein